MKKNILFIDDMLPLLELIKQGGHFEEITDSNNEFVTYNVVIHNGKSIEGEILRIKNDISNLIYEKEISIIVANNTYYKYLSDTPDYIHKSKEYRIELYDIFKDFNLKNSYNIENILIYNYHYLSKSYTDKIKKICIDLFLVSPYIFETEINFRKETDNIFITPQDNIYRVNKSMIHDYANLILGLLNQIIHRNEDNSYNINISESANTYIKNFNRANPIAMKGYQIGLMCLVTNYLSETERVIIDAPFKDYYPSLNRNLEREGWANDIYKDEKGNFIKDAWVFFEFTKNGNTFDIFHFDSNIKDNEKNNNLKNFLPILYLGVYHDANISLDYFDKKCVINNNSDKKNGIKTFKFILFFTNSNPFLHTSNNIKDVFNSNYVIYKQDDSDIDIKNLKDEILQFQDIICPLIENGIEGMGVQISAEVIQKNNKEGQFKKQRHNIKNFKTVVNPFYTKVSQTLENLGREEIARNFNIMRLVFENCIYMLLDEYESIHSGYELSKNAPCKLSDFLKHFEAYYTCCFGINNDNKYPHPNFKIEYEKEADITLDIKDLANVYNIMLNIMDNAKNSAEMEGKWSLLLHYKDGNKLISIKNSGILPRECINYYLDLGWDDNLFANKQEYDKVKAYYQFKGLGIIKECLKAIGWKIKQPIITKEEDNTTEIIIQIYPNSKIKQ